MCAITTLLTACLGLAPADDVVAMVLEVKGKPNFVRGGVEKPLRNLTLLRAGDRLNAGDGVTLVVYKDGHTETLKAGVVAVVAVEGCQKDAVAGRRDAPLARDGVEALPRQEGSGRGGAGVPRGKGDDAAGGLTPMFAATVATTRPTFVWPAVNGAERYEVRLLQLDEKDKIKKVEWTETTKEPRLEFPTGKQLKPLATRAWRVTAAIKEGTETRDREVAFGTFTVAEESEIEQLQKLKPLLESKEPADWMLAAAVYEGYGINDDALRLYEKVAAWQAEHKREDGNLHAALSRYYARAGLKDKAEAARNKAETLGVSLEKK